VAERLLLVTADDFGIGPATSEAILELATAGLVTSSVLLVNSPYAESAVELWRRAGRPMELGWHPCLTLDQPVLPASQVSSLVDGRGRFWPLGKFLGRLHSGRISSAEILLELQAQHARYCELVGERPGVVNSHHHVQVFGPVGRMLHAVLSRQQPLPYLRRIREPAGCIRRVPGARLKRTVLSFFGRGEARAARRAGFTGNEWLIGVTDPPCVALPNYLPRWLASIPGNVVELTCHPGRLDPTLVGRDCTEKDGQLQRRVDELAALSHPSFQTACRQAGFRLVPPSFLRNPHELVREQKAA
jgi:predicted glycoside hydrolase/deacetylase ChbG (UPF0249 family)